MSSSSYSALLRRSKLASYSPSIEQVYTTTPSLSSRSNFGLKRPLPPSTQKAPFIRVTSLDNAQKRTEWRKGTKEVSFTRKWGEVGVGVGTNTGYGGRGGEQLAEEGMEVQSRFVPQGWGAGGIKDLVQAKEQAQQRRRAPNVFLMAEDEFERFLDSLGARREEFRLFALAELQKTKKGSEATTLDLYEHAQEQPTHLSRIIERFLALPSPSPSAAPLPSPHPTLALQYSSPTALESALAPPIPGRLLGPSPSYQQHSHRPSTLSANKSQLYTSILGQVSPIGAQQTAGTAYTTFFPDASSTRSNQPGRTTFTVRPTVNAAAYASRVNLAAHRGNAPFRPSIPAYEPQVLSHKTLDLQPSVSTRRPSIPGTQAYSGSLPPSPVRRSGVSATSLSDLMPTTFGSSRRLREGARTNLYDGKRQSFEQNLAYKRTGRALMEERRAVDGKVFSSARGGRGEGKKAEGKGGKEGKGAKGERRKDLVDQLNDLLGPKGGQE